MDKKTYLVVENLSGETWRNEYECDCMLDVIIGMICLGSPLTGVFQRVLQILMLRENVMMVSLAQVGVVARLSQHQVDTASATATVAAIFQRAKWNNSFPFPFIRAVVWWGLDIFAVCLDEILISHSQSKLIITRQDGADPAN